MVQQVHHQVYGTLVVGPCPVENLPAPVVPKLINGICRSVDAGEKFVAFHAFDEKSRSTCVHCHSTNCRIISGS